MMHMNLTRRRMMGAMAATAAASVIDFGLPSIALAESIPGTRIDAAVKAAYDRFKTLNEGKNADYIPALAEVTAATAAAQRGNELIGRLAAMLETEH